MESPLLNKRRRFSGPLEAFSFVGNFDSTRGVAFLVAQGLPFAGASACSYLYDLVDQLILARLGVNYLGGAASGFIFTSLLDTVFLSVAEQLQVVGSAVYGSGNLPELRRLYRVWLACSLILGVPGYLLRSSTHFMLGTVFGVPGELCELAQIYVNIRRYSLPIDAVYLCTKAYITVQGHIRVGLVASIFSAIVNAIVAYSFVFVLGFGYEGAALASVLVSWMRGIGLVLYVFSSRGLHLAFGYRSSIFLSLFSAARVMLFVRLALSNLGSVFESIIWQAMTALVASLGPVYLAAHELCVTLLGLFSVVGTGLGQSTALLLGYSIGRRDEVAAKKWIVLGFFATAVAGLFLGILEQLLGESFFALVSKDPELFEAMNSIKLLLALVIAFQLVWWCLYDVLLTIGMAVRASWVAVVTGCLIMLPMAYMLRPNYGLPGVWASIFIGYTISMVIQLFMVMTADIHSMITRINKRNESVSKPCDSDLPK